MRSPGTIWRLLPAIVAIASVAILATALVVAFQATARASQRSGLEPTAAGAVPDMGAALDRWGDDGLGGDGTDVAGVPANPDDGECADGFSIVAVETDRGVEVQWTCRHAENMRGYKLRRGEDGQSKQDLGMSGHWARGYTGPIPQRFSLPGDEIEEGTLYEIRLMDADENILATSEHFHVSGSPPPDPGPDTPEPDSVSPPFTAEPRQCGDDDFVLRYGAGPHGDANRRCHSRRLHLRRPRSQRRLQTPTHDGHSGRIPRRPPRRPLTCQRPLPTATPGPTATSDSGSSGHCHRYPGADGNAHAHATGSPSLSLRSPGCR